MPNMPAYNTSEVRSPNLRLKLDGVTEDFIDDLYESEDEHEQEQARPVIPKSPAAGFTSFFGWNSAKQNGAESPTTTFSDKSLSPAASPRFPKQPSMPAMTKPIGLNMPMANTLSQPSYFNVPGTPLLSSSPQMNAHVEELERELREVSSELAASIRREMELEDEVERWKSETMTTMSVDNRRTSDYYSDSGASSIRFPISDPESKLEEVETLRRKAEQERATLKVQMAERLSDELRRRRDLEEQVQQLEDKVSGPSGTSGASGSRVKELETSLQDAQRRLAEERQVKENFEDLLTALRDELEQHRNERDNLRDEVVPQLRARLEGLESEAADTQGLMYETTRMQQEIQQLRTENQMLVNTRRMQQDMTQQATRFQPIGAIAEEGESLQKTNPRVGLSRSNSLARSSGFASKRGSLQRSNSVKDKSGAASPLEGRATGCPSQSPKAPFATARDAAKGL
jgi:DNA repair exonuclease SbcCD ATPase subunit